MVKILDHKRAIAMRMNGKSYNEIAKELGICKSSLSYWLRDLKLSKEAQDILGRKSNYPKEKFAEYNRLKSKKVALENSQIRENACNKIDFVSDKELLLIGAALYWGEGYKNNQSKRKNYHISFVNSDPEMAKIFLKFVKNILNVPEDKIRPRIQLHHNVSRDGALDYWSKITAISKDRFYIIF